MTLIQIETISMIGLAVAGIACLYLNLVLYQKKYAQHVVFDQPTTLQKKLIEKPYFYFIITLLLVVFYTWLLANYMEGNTQQFFFGAFISLCSILLGQAAGGILIFLYSIRSPEKISGQTVFEGKKFRLLHLQPTLMTCLALLIPLAVIYKTPFIFGALAAAILMEFVIMLKIIRA